MTTNHEPESRNEGLTPDPRVSDLIAEHLDLCEALDASPPGIPAAALLDQVEATQDEVDRIGLGGGGTWSALDAMTRLGVETLKVVSAMRPTSPEELRRRATAYARQRCDAAVAVLFAYALERDRRRLRMDLRDLA